MDFTLDGEQTALRDAVRGLLKGYDAEHRREVVAEDPGFDEKLWGRLAEMGVLGLPFTEDDGGMGAGPAEVSVVAEEFGRVIAPEPFVEAVVLAGGLVAALGSDEQKKEILGGLSSGELVPAFAWSDPTGGEGGVTVDGDTLSGVKEPVLNGVAPTCSSCSRRAGCSWSSPTTRRSRRTRPSTAAAPPASPSTSPPPPRSARAATRPRRPRT